MLGHVLVPLDGSIFARNAISYARKILRPGGKFTFLSVYEDASLSYVSHHYMYNGGYHEQMVERGIHVQEKYLEGLARQLRDLGYVVECMVTRGVPARTIAELADKQQVDAIVMTTHGRTGLQKLIPRQCSESCPQPLPVRRCFSCRVMPLRGNMSWKIFGMS